MNFTDTTHYLFPVENKPGTENILPWLDETLNKTTNDAVDNSGQNTNGSKNSVTDDWQGGSIHKQTDDPNFPVLAINSLQEKFTTYDTDHSGTLDFKELDANAAADPAAAWALQRYGALSKVAGDDYVKSIGLERLGTYMPKKGTEIQFKDSIPSLAGISKQDLTNALEMSNTAKMQNMLELSRQSERKDAGFNIGFGIVDLLLTYPVYRGMVNRCAPLAWVLGGLTAFGAFRQFGKSADKKRGHNTDFLATQINATRKMLGLDELVSGSQEIKNKSQSKDENPGKEKTQLIEDNLNQCQQKSTSDDLEALRKKKESESEESKKDLGDQSIESQILNLQTGIK